MKFCQNCGKEIMEDVKFCPSCGTAIAVDEKEVLTEEQIDETSNETLAEENTVDLTSEKETYVDTVAPVKKKFVLSKKMLIIIGVALVVLIIVGAIIGNAVSLSKYEKKLEAAYENITYGAQRAEEYATLESKVWYNCIQENASTETDKYTKNEYGMFYSDFNDALLSFHTGESLTYSAVSLNVSTVDTYMSELKDCPNKFEDEYMALKELYVAYSDLTDLVVGSSSYSYNTFSDALNSAKSNYKTALSSAKLLLE